MVNYNTRLEQLLQRKPTQTDLREIRDRWFDLHEVKTNQSLAIFEDQLEADIEAAQEMGISTDVIEQGMREYAASQIAEVSKRNSRREKIRGLGIKVGAAVSGLMLLATAAGVYSGAKSASNDHAIQQQFYGPLETIMGEAQCPIDSEGEVNIHDIDEVVEIMEKSHLKKSSLTHKIMNGNNDIIYDKVVNGMRVRAQRVSNYIFSDDKSIDGKYEEHLFLFFGPEEGNFKSFYQFSPTDDYGRLQIDRVITPLSDYKPMSAVLVDCDGSKKLVEFGWDNVTEINKDGIVVYESDDVEVYQAHAKQVLGEFLTLHKRGPNVPEQ
jgi:hypothetical protein